MFKLTCPSKKIILTNLWTKVGIKIHFKLILKYIIMVLITAIPTLQKLIVAYILIQSVCPLSKVPTSAYY